VWPSACGRCAVTVDGIQADGFFQVAQFPAGATHGQNAVGEDGQAGGIVAAIFEPAQTVEDDGDGAAVADIADNSTHDVYSSVSGGGGRKKAPPHIEPRAYPSTDIRTGIVLIEVTP